ncbi:MAG TPA: nuclear transport factor 2 family protein [Vicinamibacterales bacterium]|jgi:ketosteroid isomerase-like protein
MKQLCLGVAVASLAGILASAQQSGSAADEVVRAERAEVGATVKKDRAALEKLYADDYSYTHSNGVVASKAEDLAADVAADMKWTSFTLTDTKVRAYGDAAILTGVETLQGSAKGYVPGPRRLTDVWVKRNGQWQMAGGASTIVSKDTGPTTAALSAVKDLKAKTIGGKTADERAVIQADEAFARADGANDEAKQKAMQTKDFSFVSRAGAVASPNDPAAPKTTSMVAAYDSIRAYGTLAIVQGSLLWNDVNKFSPGVLRFVRVWVKDGAAWKLAAEQRTPISAAAARPKT